MYTFLRYVILVQTDQIGRRVFIKALEDAPRKAPQTVKDANQPYLGRAGLPSKTNRAPSFPLFQEALRP